MHDLSVEQKANVRWEQFPAGISIAGEIMIRYTQRSAVIGALLAWSSFSIIGCGGDNNNNINQSAPAPAPGAVSPTPSPTVTPVIININITQIFVSQTIVVQQTIVNNIVTVVFFNNDTVNHSIVADNGSFDSGVIAPGQSGSVSINQPGDFPIHCGVHPNDANERGTIRVLPPVAPSPSPSVSPSASPSPSVSPSVSPSPSATPSASPSVSPSPSPSPSASPSASPSVSPSPSATASGGATPGPLVSPPGTIIITSGAASRTSDAFAPGPINVPQNSTATITNSDTVAHTATADDGSFDTGVIQPGQSATITVSQTGDIPFHCKIHPNMTGVIHVEGTSQASPSPSASPL